MGKVLTIIAFVFLLSGCDAITSFLSPTPVPQSGDILFFDDFSDPNSGWGSWNADGSAVAYHSGGLRILVGKPSLSFWSLPGTSYTDAVIKVDAQKMSGPANNSYGVICRYQDEQNMVGGIISSDQYGGLFRMVDGETTILSDNGMLTYQPIVNEEGINQLELRCEGSQYVLWVNGMRIANWEDDTFASGQVGVIVTSLTEPGVDVLFDNYLVTQP